MQGETEQEARDFWDEYVNEKGDWEAATNLVDTMGLNSQGRSPELLQTMKTHFIGGWGGYPLIGTAEQVVDGLAMLSRLGLDGVVMSWPRYIDDMRHVPARHAAADEAGGTALEQHLRSFPRKRKSSAESLFVKALGPRFRGDERRASHAS